MQKQNLERFIQWWEINRPRSVSCLQEISEQLQSTFSGIANSSNVRLDNFYWRDTLPAEVRLDTVVAGTYNFPGTYKITYRVNGGEYRTLADNLSTSKPTRLAASATALGLASNERVTEVMFVFGQAPAGFCPGRKAVPPLHRRGQPGLHLVCQCGRRGRRLQRPVGAGCQPLGDHGVRANLPFPPCPGRGIKPLGDSQKL